MKKFLALLVLAMTVVVAAQAQFTTPRTGTGYRNDARKLTYSYTTPTDAASVTIDTFAVTPNAYVATYRLVLVDSVCAGNPTVTNCYAGDEVQFIVSAASGTPKLKFVGSNWQSAGTATLSTGLRAVITFVFDGAKYVEKSRVVQ